MNTDFRTRIELTCWNLIIPMMTKVQRIQISHQPIQMKPLTLINFVLQILLWSAAGLLVGFGMSSICTFLQ